MVQFYKTKKTKSQSPRVMTCQVSGIDHQLQGIIHHQRETYFVADALPDETIKIQIKGKHQAQLLKVLTPSGQRIAPECSYYGACGGCQGQILSAEDQRDYKAQEVAQLLTQLSGYTDLPDVEWLYGSPWHYRRAARLATWFDERQGWIAGFRQRSSKKLVKVAHCQVLSKSLNPLLKPLADLLGIFKKSFRLGHIELYDCQPQPVVKLHANSELSTEQLQACKTFAEQWQVSFYVSDPQGQRLLSGEKSYYALADGSVIHFTPGDFIQVNAALNEQLIQWALDQLDAQANEQVLDLFAGVGNFTIPLAKRARSVVAVEGVSQMSEQIQMNAQLNQCANVTAISGDLDDPQTLTGWCEQADKVLLDPARSGAKTALEAVAKAGVKAVVYIACDPATMARDLAVAQAHGYLIKRWALIDMFSQTRHIETAVLLTAH